MARSPRKKHGIVIVTPRGVLLTLAMAATISLFLLQDTTTSSSAARPPVYRSLRATVDDTLPQTSGTSSSTTPSSSSKLPDDAVPTIPIKTTNGSTGGLSQEATPEEFQRVIKLLLKSDDEVIRTAAGLLQTQSRDLGCDEDDEEEENKLWNRGEKINTSNNTITRDIALCTIIRNEAKFLDEWIAFHWAQGVGKFIIYDDGSTDHPSDILDKYVRKGIVDYYYVDTTDELSGTEELQWEKMNECLGHLYSISEAQRLHYASFLDLDEYIFPSASTTTLSNLFQDQYGDETCLLVPRTYYGTSMRHKSVEGGLMMANYVMRSPLAEDGFPKVVLNLYPRQGKPVETLFSVHAITGGEGIRPCKEPALEVRINHYVRSLDHYDLKVKTHYREMSRYDRDPLDLFWERDRNDEYDDAALERYGCQVMALLQHPPS